MSGGNNCKFLLSVGLIVMVVLISGCLGYTEEEVDGWAYDRCYTGSASHCMTDFCRDDPPHAIAGDVNYTFEECFDACINMVCGVYLNE